MGKKSAPKAPPAPDPTKIIQEQAKYNRYGTSTPFGSTSWQGTPGTPGYGVTTTLSPQMQGILDRVYSSVGQSPEARSFSGQHAIPEYGGDQYNALRDAIYGSQMESLEPDFNRQWRTFEQGMANRGQPLGGEMYADQYGLLADAQNRARTQAARDATIGARNAFIDDRNFANLQNMQDFQIQEGMLGADRGYGLDQYNQLAGLLGMIPSAGGQPLDVTGPYDSQYQGQLAKYQGQMQNYNNMWGGLGNLAGTGLLAWQLSRLSDARLKDNVVRTGTTSKGVPWYRFTWRKDGTAGEGVLAQEVQRIIPSAVLRGPDGFLRVRYDMVGEIV